MHGIKILLVINLLFAILLTNSFAREVTVLGAVVDSLSSKPLAEAQVAILTGTSSDTIVTDKDGKFNGTVELMDMATEVFVTIGKEGYLPTYSRVAVDTTSNSADCGTVKVQSISIGIETRNSFNLSLGDPVSVKLFSLHGQLIYAGPAGPLHKYKWHKRNSGIQPLILQYKYKDGRSSVCKILNRVK